MRVTTRAQREALWLLFKRKNPSASLPDWQRAYRRFRRGFRLYYGGFVGGAWCGMFIGIEPDGYTHT